MDDQQAAARAARGDQRAFECLYRAHATRIHTLAGRLLGAERAEDATQEVFLRAWSKLDLYSGQSRFGTWLHRLALNLLSNQARKLEFLTEPAQADPPAPVWDDAFRLDLEQSLARLPRGARQVFVLHDVEGLAHDEIADLLQVSEGTSKSQLHRARMLLRGFLRDRVTDHEV